MTTQDPYDDLLGKTLGQFEILEKIGRGGMAVVYKGRQKSVNRVVAVKILPRHFLHDPGFYERFEREVDVIAHLEHPHILPIYDYGQADGVPFIAMRFLNGGSLEDYIRRGVKPVADLEKPLRQIAQALDYAHRQGVIHRDIKPGNIMLDESDNAYLSDFGIARVLGSNMTGSMIVGTPAYMSPEQANGLPIDGRADIYALGVVLFELITGREPYQAETPMAVLLKHINEPMPPISNYRNDVPPEVEGVVQKATAKDPNDRYTSAAEMAADFSRALRGEPAGFDSATRSKAPAGLTPGAVPAPVPAISSAEVTSVSSEHATRTLPTRPAPSAGMLVAAVMILAIVGAGAFAGFTILGAEPTYIIATPSRTVAATPTLFSPQAAAVNSDLYSLAMLRSWEFSDLSNPAEPNRVVHVWQPPGANSLDAYVGLEILQVNQMNTEIAFRRAVDSYIQQYIRPQGIYQPIEDLPEETAPDGTIRRSYRLIGATNPPFPPGQIDLFFLNHGRNLVMFSVYSSDAMGDTLVPTFQNMLDSLRIHR